MLRHLKMPKHQNYDLKKANRIPNIIPICPIQKMNIHLIRLAWDSEIFWFTFEISSVSLFSNLSSTKTSTSSFNFEFDLLRRSITASTTSSSHVCLSTRGPTNISVFLPPAGTYQPTVFRITFINIAFFFSKSINFFNKVNVFLLSKFHQPTNEKWGTFTENESLIK